MIFVRRTMKVKYHSDVTKNIYPNSGNWSSTLSEKKIIRTQENNKVHGARIRKL